MARPAPPPTSCLPGPPTSSALSGVTVAPISYAERGAAQRVAPRQKAQNISFRSCVYTRDIFSALQGLRLRCGTMP